MFCEQLSNTSITSQLDSIFLTEANKAFALKKCIFIKKESSHIGSGILPSRIVVSISNNPFYELPENIDKTSRATVFHCLPSCFQPVCPEFCSYSVTVYARRRNMQTKSHDNWDEMYTLLSTISPNLFDYLPDYLTTARFIVLLRHIETFRLLFSKDQIAIN